MKEIGPDINTDYDCMTEEEKDKEIKNIINDIIDYGVKDVENFILRFDKIYKNGYRHKYSEVLLFLIEKEDESLDYLVENIEHLRDEIFSKECSFRKCFFKLYDHVMLEVTRIRVYHDYEKREKLIEGKVNVANSQFQYYSNSCDQLNNRILEVNEEVRSFNTQSISILGIFSAIVIAFFGSLKVAENIFQTLSNDTGISRVISISSIIGIIVFDVIFLLLYFIAKISNKSIATNDLQRLYNECNEWNTEKGQADKSSKAIKKYKKVLKSPFKRLRIRYPIVFWFNLFLIIVMLISILFLSIDSQIIFWQMLKILGMR